MCTESCERLQFSFGLDQILLLFHGPWVINFDKTYKIGIFCAVLGADAAAAAAAATISGNFLYCNT